MSFGFFTADLLTGIVIGVCLHVIFPVKLPFVSRWANDGWAWVWRNTLGRI